MAWGPFEAKDRKIGTDDFTEVAIHTIRFFFHIWIMISLAIELSRKSQDLSGAIFNAKSAPFTPLDIDMELTMRNFHLVYI